MRIDFLKPFGVELPDTDVRKLSGIELDKLRSLVSEHGIVVVKDQPLDEDEHVDLFRRMYPGQPLGMEPNGQCLAYVSNIREDGVFGDSASTFHSDFSFTTAPNKINSLYGVEVDPSASPTEFASGILGLAVIPDRLRTSLEGLNVITAADFTKESYVDRMAVLNLPGREDLSGRSHRDVVRARWPAIYRHPITGNRQLFMSEAHAHHFEGVSLAKSREMIAEVLDYMYAPENIYSHDWAVGDLLLWDNIVVTHGRRATPPNMARRTLRRVCIGEADFNRLWDWSEEGVV